MSDRFFALGLHEGLPGRIEVGDTVAVNSEGVRYRGRFAEVVADLGPRVKVRLPDGREATYRRYRLRRWARASRNGSNDASS